MSSTHPTASTISLGTSGSRAIVWVVERCLVMVLRVTGRFSFSTLCSHLYTSFAHPYTVASFDAWLSVSTPPSATASSSPHLSAVCMPYSPVTSTSAAHCTVFSFRPCLSLVSSQTPSSCAPALSSQSVFKSCPPCTWQSWPAHALFPTKIANSDRSGKHLCFCCWL